MFGNLKENNKVDWMELKVMALLKNKRIFINHLSINNESGSLFITKFILPNLAEI